jgi:hypothetical protein
MTTAQNSLQLQLDEVDMTAYSNDFEPICLFYYDDSFDSDEAIERARAIIHRVNLHDELLDALEYFFNIMHDYECSVRKGYVKIAFHKAREAIAKAKGSSI